MNMEGRKKIYFLSDVHLGSVAPSSHTHDTTIAAASLFGEKMVTPLKPIDHTREQKLCRWLDMIKKDAKELYLLGDIFDYWFEYKTVVPRGFTRFLGKISELSDSGIEIHFFIGNHDIWTTDYLQRECGIIVHKGALVKDLYGKKFFMAHGDGLGDRSISFKILRYIFHNSFCRRLFAAIHPGLTIPFAHKWSSHSRSTGYLADYLGEDKEYLVQFAKEHLKIAPNINFFIFGHRHIMLDLQLKTTARVIVLGDWIHHFSYGVFDGKIFSLEVFEDINQ